jgi:hypothetical protein
VNSNVFNAPDDAPVLVAVMNEPRDLARAQEHGWYRIPLSRAPSRVGADFLAFYQTGAFPLNERWAVHWFASVRGYHLTTRHDLIPEEPDHPRANDRYYRVDLGPLELLPLPIPSRRLRRISFIHTTMARLLAAHEINDLWMRTPAQERLWQALRQAGLDTDTEHEYPLIDDLPYTADFAILGERNRIAVVMTEVSQVGGHFRESASLAYPLARGDWRAIFVDRTDAVAIASCLRQILDIRSDSSDS